MLRSTERRRVSAASAQSKSRSKARPAFVPKAIYRAQDRIEQLTSKLKRIAPVMPVDRAVRPESK
jgi:hypothetical protein